MEDRKQKNHTRTENEERKKFKLKQSIANYYTYRNLPLDDMVLFFESSTILWELCKLYGLQLFVIGALSILTIYRREISCNNIYHHSPDQLQQPLLLRRSRQLNNHNDRRRTTTQHNIEVDRWLLLEHCCYGLAFGPLLSLVYFLCRIITLSMASLWERMKTALVIERYTNESDNTSLRHAVAQEWSLCQRQGFHCPSFTTTTTMKTVLHRSTHDANNIDQQSQYLIQLIPRDVQFLMLSFLPVNDVLAYGLTCKYFHSLVHCGSVAYPLWNTLTVRDFHDFIHWDVAQQRFHECMTRTTTRQQQQQLSSSKQKGSYRATATSNPILIFLNNWHTQWAASPSPSDDSKNNNNNKTVQNNTTDHHRILFSARGGRRKVYEMYFTLYVTCIPWSLALRNTTNCCYVGLYNAVYCITSFLPDHPGSVETLLLHAGTDASQIFEAVGHSTTARSLADTMCVWKMKPLCEREDYYYNTSTAADIRTQWRQRRNHHHSLSPSSQQQAGTNTTITSAAAAAYEYYYCNNKDTTSLALSIIHGITEWLSEEERHVRRIAEKWLHLEILVGDTFHLFYDPFIQSWCCWYTSLTTEGDLEPVMMYIDDHLLPTHNIIKQI